MRIACWRLGSAQVAMNSYKVLKELAALSSAIRRTHMPTHDGSQTSYSMEDVCRVQTIVQFSHLGARSRVVVKLGEAMFAKVATFCKEFLAKNTCVNDSIAATLEAAGGELFNPMVLVWKNCFGYPAVTKFSMAESAADPAVMGCIASLASNTVFQNETIVKMLTFATDYADWNLRNQTSFISICVTTMSGIANLAIHLEAVSRESSRLTPDRAAEFNKLNGQITSLKDFATTLGDEQLESLWMIPEGCVHYKVLAGLVGQPLNLKDHLG